MLEMTTRAATLLAELRTKSEIPDDAGVRVFGGQNDDGQPALAMAFTSDPQPGDEVSETEGVRLFVAQEVATPLNDTVIDVTGENDASQLVFRPRIEPAQA